MVHAGDRSYTALQENDFKLRLNVFITYMCFGLHLTETVMSTSLSYSTTLKANIQVCLG